MDADEEILRKIKRQREKARFLEMTKEQWVYYKYGYNEGKLSGVVTTILTEIFIGFMLGILTYMVINTPL